MGYRKINVFLSAAAVVVIIGLLHAAPKGPCDIYQEAGTPCVAAYSTARVLNSSYTGPLYQVRRSSDQQVKDIPALPDGVVDASVQDDFLGSGAGTISKIYDQSGKGNDLVKAPAGCFNGTASEPDKEANAKGKQFMINGRKAYAIYINPVEGYRDNQTNGMPTGNAPQGIYALEDGSRPNVGNACCFDFGNASTDNCHGSTGQMNTLFFGVCTYWGKGTGNGPWFLNDMEAGVWATGYGASNAVNNKLPSSKFDFAFGITKTSTTNGTPEWALRVADGTVGNKASPKLITAYDGRAPSTWKMEGGIVLGIGGDNSNSSNGTFYEGCITAGRPSDETDEKILKNVIEACYGCTTPVATAYNTPYDLTSTPTVMVRYNPSDNRALISYTLRQSGHADLSIFDQQGKRVATITDAVVSAGRHETEWIIRKPAGVYVARLALDNRHEWTEKIITGK